MEMPARMRPLLSSMLYAARRAWALETWARGELEPSLTRKIGSVPPVASKRVWIPAALTPMFWLGWWHVTHRRPFAPRLRKKGLLSATTGKPETLIVRAFPDSLSTVKMAPCGPPLSAPRARGASIPAPITITRPIAITRPPYARSTLRIVSSGLREIPPVGLPWHDTADRAPGAATLARRNARTKADAR